MRVLLTTIYILAFCAIGYPQTSLPKPTSTFTINGRVKSPKTFTLDEIVKLGVHNIGDVVITNHKGEAKGTAKELSGVLLTEVLKLIELDAESAKVFSEYSFVCYASDG
jgi:DMSO/TMAO reductase YedYZ molybdopterin-dependent catalytic subunit